MEESDITTTPWWVWLGLSVVACVSFWTQATVTEERLVPALNIISDYYNIPSDIAGATLMAAGASSPELFSSIIALFVTHSSLGLGTIVGSEIFNQLIICAGAVYSSQSGSLELDKAIVIREVGFYGLAIILLYIALEDVEPVDDDAMGVKHIFISFWESCMLFGGYVVYVLVCTYMDAVVMCFTRTHEGLSGSQHLAYGSISTDDVPLRMPFVLQYKDLSNEPKSNWRHVEYLMPAESFRSYETHTQNQEFRHQSSSLSDTATLQRGSLLLDSLRRSIEEGIMISLLQRSQRPTELTSTYDVEDNEETGVFRCFLWQQSPFYTNAKFGSHAWHLRWFTMTTEALTSVPSRDAPDRHIMKYPRFQCLEVDNDRLIIRMVNLQSGKRDFTLMAPSKIIFSHALEKLDGYLKLAAMLQDKTVKEDLIESENSFNNEAGVLSHPEPTLIELPLEASFLQLLTFLSLFPVRLCMHFTVPDVRLTDAHGIPKRGIKTAMFTTFMCLVWLILGSYTMVASLESIAELLNIPDAVIGFTVSAAGTSLPNYVASRVAAEKGFGNQAVSNAFGSNTFNIMVGLGLPWLLYTSVGTGFQSYHGLPADGILESIIILAAVLLVFIVLMLCSGFVLLRWHGALFIVLYFAYILFAILQVYIK